MRLGWDLSLSPTIMILHFVFSTCLFGWWSNSSVLTVRRTDIYGDLWLRTRMITWIRALSSTLTIELRTQWSWWAATRHRYYWVIMDVVISLCICLSASEGLAVVWMWYWRRGWLVFWTVLNVTFLGMLVTYNTSCWTIETEIGLNSL